MLFYAMISSGGFKYYDYLITLNPNSPLAGVQTFTSYGLNIYSSAYSFATPIYLILGPKIIFTAGLYKTFNNVAVDYTYFGKYPATYYLPYTETITYQVIIDTAAFQDLSTPIFKSTSENSIIRFYRYTSSM